MTQQVAQKFSLDGKRVWVAGHTGMVGSAVVRRLEQENCTVSVANRREVDLTCQQSVEKWVKEKKFDVIVLAAAKVGGIHANNNYPADFIYDNLAIEMNVIRAAKDFGVEKLIFLGSSCIYPRHAEQPITESALLTGSLEPTNEWYAIAKIAGIKLCQASRRQYGCDFISLMPTNLYGSHDNWHPEDSHVPAALMRRFHEAKINGDESVQVWGTGAPKREFLYVDDLADATVFLLKNYSDEEIVNVGTGTDITIKEFAELIKTIVGFKGTIDFDSSRPDGMPRKLLNVDKLSNLGWVAPTPLGDGLRQTYEWFNRAYDNNELAERGSSATK